MGPDDGREHVGRVLQQMAEEDERHKDHVGPEPVLLFVGQRPAGSTDRSGLRLPGTAVKGDAFLHYSLASVVARPLVVRKVVTGRVVVVRRAVVEEVVFGLDWTSGESASAPSATSS